MRLAIRGIGFVAPGLDGWAAALPVLRGEAAYVSSTLPAFKPMLLPPNERRRATRSCRLALRAVEDLASDYAALSFATVASVFASSGGDMQNLHELCEQLARDPKGISPTAFHNSVHNAVAGYFGIATVDRAGSVSISAHDSTFAAGLLEAAALVADVAAPVLLVAYDAVAPEPLFTARPVEPDCAVALLLAPVDAAASCIIAVEPSPAANADVAARAPSPCALAALEPLRGGNPAARALPLLELLARAATGTVVLGELGNRVVVTVLNGSPILAPRL